MARGDYKIDSFHLTLTGLDRTQLYYYLLSKNPSMGIYYEKIEQKLIELGPNWISKFRISELNSINSDLTETIKNAPFNLVLVLLYDMGDGNFLFLIDYMLRRDLSNCVNSINDIYTFISICLELNFNDRCKKELMRILFRLLKPCYMKTISIYLNKFSESSINFYNRLWFIFEQFNYCNIFYRFFALPILTTRFIISYDDIPLLNDGTLLDQPNSLLNKYDELRPLIILKNKLQWAFISAVIRASFLKKHFGIGKIDFLNI